MLVLGAGEMGEAMALGLAKAGVADIAVANRTWERAVELAERAQGRAVRLHDVPSRARRGRRAALLDGRRGRRSSRSTTCGRSSPLAADRPLLIVDIAVPRDVDPAVGALDGVTLLDMDDLRAFADAGTRRPQAARSLPSRPSSTTSSSATWAPPPPARSPR